MQGEELAQEEARFVGDHPSLASSARLGTRPRQVRVLPDAAAARSAPVPDRSRHREDARRAIAIEKPCTLVLRVQPPQGAKPLRPRSEDWSSGSTLRSSPPDLGRALRLERPSSHGANADRMCDRDGARRQPPPSSSTPCRPARTRGVAPSVELSPGQSPGEPYSAPLAGRIGQTRVSRIWAMWRHDTTCARRPGCRALAEPGGLGG